MPKSIKGSVGHGGNNWSRTDVATVQYLLNCVPASSGGPVPELAVDGIVGPLTIGAIRRFQQTHFGWADGRVDPGGGTLGTLQRFDPYPQQQLGLGSTQAEMGKGAFDPAFKGGDPSAWKFGGNAPSGPAWKFGGKTFRDPAWKFGGNPLSGPGAKFGGKMGGGGKVG